MVVSEYDFMQKPKCRIFQLLTQSIGKNVNRAEKEMRKEGQEMETEGREEDEIRITKEEMTHLNYSNAIKILLLFHHTSGIVPLSLCLCPCVVSLLSLASSITIWGLNYFINSFVFSYLLPPSTYCLCFPHLHSSYHTSLCLICRDRLFCA